MHGRSEWRRRRLGDDGGGGGDAAFRKAEWFGCAAGDGNDDAKHFYNATATVGVNNANADNDGSDSEGATSNVPKPSNNKLMMSSTLSIESQLSLISTASTSVTAPVDELTAAAAPLHRWRELEAANEVSNRLCSFYFVCIEGFMY
jgi:hypothetical protein